VIALVLMADLSGCAGALGPATGGGTAGPRQSGLASWYSDALHGRPTASGEPYDRDALTAAHRSLPFGTVVRVTRTDDGRDVVVKVNDRGPFAEGRIIDLSRRAAEELGMIEEGVVRVEIVVVE
jgi:rare lipoprotein A